MQHIYKKIYFYFNNTFNITSKFFKKIFIISMILLSFNILSEEKKRFFSQSIDDKYKNVILKKKDNKIRNELLEKYKKIKNKSDLISYLSNKIFEKKIIYIRKNSNFFKSAYQSGLNKSEINNIINALEFQINFRKLSVNSKFNLIFLKNKTNSKITKNLLLGIKLNNLKKTYYAIRSINGDFYSINDLTQSKITMNFEFFKKYRISSNFNLHRLHPITHHVSRHLGIDLAMPEGTSVFSTSNGKINRTGFDSISGLYIVLNNKNQYITKYMHLKKIFVKVGQYIKINQKIALSGNTGRTTGPHLHYEIWINKKPINPIYAKSYLTKQITKKERILYSNISKIIVSKLK